MLSVRTFARSAPRAVARLSTASLRQSSIAAARPSIALLRSPAMLSVARTARAAFSTTVSRRRADDADIDGELSAKLQSELQIEEDMKASEQEPASIKDFLNNSAYKLVDTPGQESVKLERTYNDEKCVPLSLYTSIDDVRC